MDAYQMGGITSSLLGVAQLAGGLSMNPKRPTFRMPSEITQNQQIAKNAYGASTLYGLAGQGAINNQNAQTYATNLQAIKESQQNPAAMLAGINAATANQMKTNANIGIQAAQDRQNRMDRARAGLLSTNKDVASYKDKEWDLNEFQKWKAEQAAKSALIGSGIQNLTGGMTSLGSAGNRRLMDAYYKKQLGIV